MTLSTFLFIITGVFLNAGAQLLLKAGVNPLGAITVEWTTLVPTIGRVLILPRGASYALTFAFDGLMRLSGLGPFEPTESARVYFWFGIGLANDFFFGFCWARYHLLKDFRHAATQRYQPAKFGWLIRPFRRKDVVPVTVREREAQE